MSLSQTRFDFVAEARAIQTQTDTLFLALKPSSTTAAQIATQAQQLMRDVKLAPPLIATDRLHVSLHAFGRYSNPPQWLIRTINSSLSRFCHAPVEIGFDRLTFGFGGGAVVLRGGNREPLRALQTRLLRHLSSRRRTYNTREPHMTICYSPARLPEKQIQPITWVANEIVLIHSRYGHRQLGSWPLDSPMPTPLTPPVRPLQGELFA